VYINGSTNRRISCCHLSRGHSADLRILLRGKGFGQTATALAKVSRTYIPRVVEFRLVASGIASFGRSSRGKHRFFRLNLERRYVLRFAASDRTELCTERTNAALRSFRQHLRRGPAHLEHRPLIAGRFSFLETTNGMSGNSGQAGGPDADKLIGRGAAAIYSALSQELLPAICFAQGSRSHKCHTSVM
jgi:hypothetical protein